MFSAKILADSLNICSCRLTTFELTYPRFVHSELLTHRMLSRNSASSRAIPVEKMLARIRTNPVIPIHLGKNQSGMQAEVEIEDSLRDRVLEIWNYACADAIEHAAQLHKLGVHKQIVNRIVEPYMWITVIASATNWVHFFSLRDHPAAEPHIRHLAAMMRDVYNNSTPVLKSPGEWHLPLWGFEGDDIAAEEYKGINIPAKVSAGRCARVSYLTHDGRRDVQADIDLYNRLSTATPGHWSPLEHPAMSMSSNVAFGNFTGWKQLRKFHENEYLKEKGEMECRYNGARNAVDTV